jgi:glycine/D-amino acid oxidase-like deaminating enzyme
MELSNMPYEVVIIGSGVAGSSAAYHLSQAGVRNVLVIDNGKMPGEATPERPSGSAVMAAAPTIKMMVQVFACSSKYYISHHGVEGARRYLELTYEGLQIQKDLAKRVALTSPSQQLRELGSFYVGYQSDEEELLEEYHTLKSLGCKDITWFDSAMLADVPGCSPDFYCAIYFPNDAVIDSSSYAKGLVRAAELSGSTTFLSNTTVTQISEETINGEHRGQIQLDSGDTIYCRHIVVATGGLYQWKDLSGVVKPCYSYLVYVPVEGSSYQCENSSNFFTCGFSHDWCFTEGKVRTSGEDHFSALKEPKDKERNKRLMEWTLRTYGCDETGLALEDIPHQFGIYSETPDSTPLIGSIDPHSDVICYLLGCNAWGQAVLSYASSLVPGLLGYEPLSDSQIDHLRLLSIRRFPFLAK